MEKIGLLVEATGAKRGKVYDLQNYFIYSIEKLCTNKDPLFKNMAK